MSNAPFDAIHSWTGDAIALESAALQAGKYAALLQLLPFVHAQSNEAASVVLHSDGRLWSFAVGTPDEVNINAPAHEKVALLHTHSLNEAHSERDWATFLGFPNIEQSHVVAPDLTYSLHKPDGWDPARYELEELRSSDIGGELEATAARNARKILGIFAQFALGAYERGGGWSASAETRVRALVSKQMATRFGVACRIGERK